MEREEMDQKPVFTIEGVTYVYVQYNNLILMSVTKRNSNVALMLVYLYKLVRYYSTLQFGADMSLGPVCSQCGVGDESLS